MSCFMSHAHYLYSCINKSLLMTSHKKYLTNLCIDTLGHYYKAMLLL